MHRTEPARTRTEQDVQLARFDTLLLTALAMGPIAAFTNTLCGFTIAHWVSQVASKVTGFLLDGFDMLLCVVAFAMGLAMHRRFRNAREDQPAEGRRYFMANLAILLAVLCFISVLFQTLNMTILHPSD